MGNRGSVEFTKTRQRLAMVDPKTVPVIPYKNVRIPCRVIDVYDGDTCTILVMLNKRLPFRMNIRALGVDTPEKARVPSELEKRVGKAVASHVSNIILDKYLDVELVKWDKYGGRILGHLWLSETETLADYLLKHGLGRPYDGEKKVVWEDEKLDEIMEICTASEKNWL